MTTMTTDDSARLAALLDFTDDPDDCDACEAAQSLPALRGESCCPYHLGINRGFEYARTLVTTALDRE